HPYYRLADSTRDEWTLNVGARSQWLLNADKIPTGETEPIEKFFHNPKAAALKDYNLDHVFGDLIRDSSGRASVSVRGKTQELQITLGPNYRALVMFSPAARSFIALEPMAGITDSMNLAQKGLYKD